MPIGESTGSCSVWSPKKAGHPADTCTKIGHLECDASGVLLCSCGVGENKRRSGRKSDPDYLEESKRPHEKKVLLHFYFSLTFKDLANSLIPGKQEASVSAQCRPGTKNNRPTVDVHLTRGANLPYDPDM